MTQALGIKLDARLQWIADQVRPKVEFIDVGTDHARLPLALIASGRIQHALAVDIAAAPLAQAQQHITAAGYGDKIDIQLSDGLRQIRLPVCADVAICGMGGDAIRRIIQAKSELKQPQIRLLLQPQTDSAVLRLYLAASGFTISDETLVKQGRRFYQAWVAHYTGQVTELNQLQAQVGVLNLQRFDAVVQTYLRHRKQLLHQWRQNQSVLTEELEAELCLLQQYVSSAMRVREDTESTN